MWLRSHKRIVVKHPYYSTIYIKALDTVHAYLIWQSPMTYTLEFSHKRNGSVGSVTTLQMENYPSLIQWYEDLIYNEG